MQGYRISTDNNELNLDVVFDFISDSYWAKGIPRERVEKSVKHSLCFGVYDARGEQVGFARLITDRATFAYLSDVFILSEHRGKGLSKWLVEVIISHPDLQGLRRIVLATHDAHGLYAQYGFEPLSHTENFMQIWNPDVYA
ncbi:GNAT family N-acetyltransferase [Vibrio agarivorans]|uniref:GNAT family N-acetyltransferase n=1 Tax=Vibrio agarivorans TaxID=153622 RepID=UPI0025B50A4E|nr:GNAT family N-acetyltransferase [Vibrio agarivorans]MDN3659832.1 GNAT family N-acetyltransferase [Vibrio agarivorans]